MTDLSDKKEHHETTMFILSNGNRISIKMEVKENNDGTVDIMTKIGNSLPNRYMFSINNPYYIDQKDSKIIK